MKRIIDLLQHPRAAVVIHDLIMVVAAWLTAGWFIERTSGIPLNASTTTAAAGLFIVLALQGGVLWATGLYKGLWRFASFQDLWNIARATATGLVLIVAAAALVQGSAISHWIPAILIYPVLLFVLLGLPRMCYRFWKDSQMPVKSSENGRKRVIILGAGRSGALLEHE
ncbi:MAG: polysaccharide biosynthesis protein, partial [Lysobacterales bacterium]